ncbi:MAG: hypothetical protein D6682_06925 [Zetaproteobacteria bacterium]|nr:MAG: hypothetical protein D6682_06925 [Zetaproteobacteria bacterium]
MAMLPPQGASAAAAAPSSGEGSVVRMMHRFTAGQEEESPQRRITLQSKREVLFWMGAGLLVGLLATAALGLGMALFGREWFVAHMISAGLTVTLGIAHAVTAVVWFWPY